MVKLGWLIAKTLSGPLTTRKKGNLARGGGGGGGVLPDSGLRLRRNHTNTKLKIPNMNKASPQITPANFHHKAESPLLPSPDEVGVTIGVSVIAGIGEDMGVVGIGEGIGVVGIGVCVTVGVSVGVAVAVCVSVAEGVGVGVRVGVRACVAVSVGVCVTVAVRVCVAVSVCVAVAEGADVGEVP